MARWASRSLARLRASCEGVSVETLRVPVTLELAHRDVDVGKRNKPQSHESLS